MASFAEHMIGARTRNRNRSASESTTARFKEILQILKKHKVERGITPESATSLLEDLGATFVKLGQIASTHPDILPAEYCDAFAKLRARVEPMPFETVQEKVEAELGKPLGELFAEFDHKAVGSASIAQVHRAVTHDGKVVAVKVQRPNVVETVTEDLAIMERIVEIYELIAHDEGRISLKDLLEELERTSRDELDFTIEAGNLVRFYDNNAGRTGVTSPRCYTKLSTSAILTEDFFDDPRIGQIDEVDWVDADAREKLAYAIADNYMSQVLEDGFYHADPHAGNILVSRERGIEWIDFGMMGVLSMHERAVLEDMVSTVVKGDAYGLKRNLMKVATPTGPVDHGSVLLACEKLIDQFVNIDLQSFDMGRLLEQMMGILKQSGFEVAPFLVTLGRGLVTLEGTVHLVSEKLNVMQVLVNHVSSSFDLGRVKKKARQMAGMGVDSLEASVGLPTKASDTLDMLQKGQVKLGMDMNVNEKFTKGLKGAVNNFAYAMMAAALVVGSCILCTTSLEPQVLGIPALGFAGFVCGLALMVYVSVLIFKSGTGGRRK